MFEEEVAGAGGCCCCREERKLELEARGVLGLCRGREVNIGAGAGEGAYMWVEDELMNTSFTATN